MMAGLRMEVLSRTARKTLLASHPLPDRSRTLPALSRTRSYFDKTAAKKEQKSQELKTITAKDHHEWGYNLLVLPQFNKGMGFGIEERQRLRIHGLLPPRVMDADTQRDRTLAKVKSLPTQLARFTYMMAIKDRNEKLFYRTIAENVSYFLPIIYTPTVGQACIEYGFHYTRPRGIFISIFDRGHIRSILENWPFVNVKAIVVTDGERILGLGDLGAYGMGIPVGKLALYTALAGIQPSECLPITIDVGTDRETILDDPFYIGVPQRRVRGPAYDDLLDEFMEAAVATFGQNVLIQFEDFAYQNAYRLIQKYQYKYNTFNDDIMGTASVAVAGIFAALRVSGKPLKDNLFMFQGAGSANLGIARLLKSALVDDGLSEDEAKQRIWMFDIGGLLVNGRSTGGLDDQTLPFAHDYKHLTTLEEAVKDLNPSVIVGASTVRGAFTPGILQHMASTHERPVIFALSNPTSRAECTAAEAYENTEGRCVFCSGSPFDPVEYRGKRFEPGQGNNAYIFPGVSLAAILGKFKHIPDRYFLIASRVLADLVSADDLELGRVYPRLDDIREISKVIAVRLIEQAYEDNLATLYPRPADLYNFITYRQYDFSYNNFLPDTWPWPDVTY